MPIYKQLYCERCSQRLNRQQLDLEFFVQPLKQTVDSNGTFVLDTAKKVNVLFLGGNEADVVFWTKQRQGVF